MPVVALAHGGHKERNEWYEYKDDPSSGCELCNRDDHKHDTGDGGASAVEEGFSAPTFSTKLSPMNHHAGLADGETKEDANRIRRN